MYRIGFQKSNLKKKTFRVMQNEAGLPLKGARYVPANTLIVIVI